MRSKVGVTTGRCRPVAVLATVLALLGLVTACGGGSSDSADNGGSSSSAEPASGGATPETSEITIESPPSAMGNIFVNLMVDKGFLEARGLSAEVVSMTPSDAMLGILAGDVDFGLFGATVPMQSQIAGQDVRIIAAGNEGFAYRIVGQPEFSAIDDLDGATVAIGGVGDVTELLLDAALENAGHDPDFVTAVPSGNGQARQAALLSGSVDAAVLIMPEWAGAEDAGMTTIVAAEELNEVTAGWPSNTWQASGAFLEDNPGTAQAFLAAFLEATEYIHANRDEVVQYAVDELDYDEARAESEYDTLAAMGGWSTTGRPDLDAMQELIDFGVEIGFFTNVSGDLLEPEAYVDLTAVDNLA
jgi:ABC-type nitrate/sulfonate/bicarbonate transport system substrate-binding protein